MFSAFYPLGIVEPGAELAAARGATGWSWALLAGGGRQPGPGRPLRLRQPRHRRDRRIAGHLRARGRRRLAAADDAVPAGAGPADRRAARARSRRSARARGSPPGSGPSDLLRFARFAVLPVRRMAEEEFRGKGGGLLLGGNALHSDLGPDSPISGFMGWLLCMLGQTVGFPAPVGGAGALTAALVRRLESRGGTVTCNSPVDEILVGDGRARGVRLANGGEVLVRRAVIADVAAPGALPEDAAARRGARAGCCTTSAASSSTTAPSRSTGRLNGPIPWTAPGRRRGRHGAPRPRHGPPHRRRRRSCRSGSSRRTPT